MLDLAGALCFLLAILHAVIGFSPGLSFYFGAPEALVQNKYALIGVCFLVAMILAVFGLYALSGAGRIPALPCLNQVLVIISGIFIFRGLIGIPEFLVVMGVIKTSIPIAPRFVFFSMVSLLEGIFFITGVISKRQKFEKKDCNHVP